MIDNSKVEAVLFDLDGTLIDAFPPIIHALNQTLEEFGKPAIAAAEIKRHTGRGDCGIKSFFEPEREAAATTRFLELHDAVYLQQLSPIEGAEKLLAWLQKKSMPMAIVTSKGQHRAEAQIKQLGWQDYFQVIIGKLESRPGKPSPIPVQMACDAVGRSYAASIMIGDGTADMKAGRRAGLFTVGITDSFSNEELEDSGASICFNSLNSVYDWLKEKVS